MVAEEREISERRELAGIVNRRKKPKIKGMDDWWQKMVFPVRKVWIAVSARVKARKHGAGLLKLRDDIQTCGYEDVQVMWEMLRRTESELTSRPHSKPKHRPFWRIFVWSNHRTCPPFSTTHAHQ
ncbi:PREDICTED: uncharacterized protein LOC109165264 [Ipomoea nil]|uniref:uncharacterized protein LOC109165264 n=1 Tax=Ipomoea nil TaxID=35883 RepID=UPI0009013C59|nr:PREDICTED: uncharacterized protein LOC109165264 [Ipomoea nil]